VAGIYSLPHHARITSAHHPKFFHEETACLKGICHATTFCFSLCPLQPTDEP
jgi:hypothetical protein